MLPEVYTSVVGLHSFVFIIYLFIYKSVSTPTVLCKLLEGGCYAIADYLYPYYSVQI